MLTIDKDVPLPVSHGAGRKKGSEFPFIDMAVGDSFFVPGRTINRIPVGSGLKRRVEGRVGGGNLLRLRCDHLAADARKAAGPGNKL